MVDTKTLALEIASKIAYTPVSDLLLVKPLKPVMVSKLVPTAPKAQAESMDDAEQQEPTEPKKQKVEANMRKGVILKLGPEYEAKEITVYDPLSGNPTTKKVPAPFEVGDIVIYPQYAGLPFELLKDSRMLRRYDVVAVEKK